MDTVFKERLVSVGP